LILELLVLELRGGIRVDGFSQLVWGWRKNSRSYFSNCGKCLRAAWQSGRHGLLNIAGQILEDLLLALLNLKKNRGGQPQVILG
jgi:hypothetical protein